MRPKKKKKTQNEKCIHLRRISTQLRSKLNCIVMLLLLHAHVEMLWKMSLIRVSSSETWLWTQRIKAWRYKETRKQKIDTNSSIDCACKRTEWLTGTYLSVKWNHQIILTSSFFRISFYWEKNKSFELTALSVHSSPPLWLAILLNFFRLTGPRLSNFSLHQLFTNDWTVTARSTRIWFAGTPLRHSVHCCQGCRIKQLIFSPAQQLKATLFERGK